MVVTLGASAARAAVVRAGHPRMLLNAETLPRIRERCGTTDKATFDALIAQLERERTVRPGRYWQTAYRARAFALAHVITAEEKYARKGLEHLDAALRAHLDAARRGGRGAGGAANWLMVRFRRANYVAYDWLYNAMTPAERKTLGQLIIDVTELHNKRETWNHAYAGGYNRYENELLAGLALAKSGVDDAKAERFLKSGFNFYMTQTIPARCQIASDDGGIAGGMGYAFYNYIPVEAYFLKCWLTATGEDLTARDTSIMNFGAWMLFASMPDGRYAPICDVSLRRNPLSRRVMMMAASLYRDGRAAWLASRSMAAAVTESAFCELIWTDHAVKPIPPDDRLPRGRHFAGLGWVTSRSDWSPDATWALFKSGIRYYGHQHCDQNHFVIFKHDLLATDAMRRVWSTLGHNTLLVFDGDDGAQARKSTDSFVKYRSNIPESDRPGEITRFETNDHYTYACGDARRAYGKKVRSFTRQFVHLQPDLFVVFDRVVSTRPTARKVWQLHADVEPETAGRVGTIIRGKGKLTTLTLLPKDAVVRKEYQRIGGSQGTVARLWNMTVEAPKPSQSELFLHVLYASDTSDSQLPEVSLLEKSGEVGARMELRDTTHIVTFAARGQPAGRVRTVKRGKALLTRELTHTVQPQSAYGAVAPNE